MTVKIAAVRIKDKGNDWQKCKCVKTMLLYDGAKPEGQRQWKQSTKWRVWEEAEQVRREWLDSFDPTKFELKRLRLEKELKTVPAPFNSRLDDWV
jgi:hypothetical protein